MTELSELEAVDLGPVVVEAFQRHLGTSDELALSSRLLADLGLDSIGFVTILLELAERLQLDLGAARVQLSSVATVDDVVALLRSLRTGEPATAVAAEE